jgi:hypothetical protein
VGSRGRMVKLRQREFTLDRQARYVVGVGSVGRPEDDPAPKYVLYDGGTASVRLRALG